LATYVTTNNKRSEQDAKRWILDRHLRPVFGAKRLDQIGRLEIDAFKAKLGKGRTPKTVNNILTVLGKILNYAVEAGFLEKAPRMHYLRVPPQSFDFL